MAKTGPVDEAAWREFVDHYGAKIYKWCRRWQVQDADAKDITQQVLLKLSTKMNTFTYDPARSFRAWLRTLTHHAWRDFVDESQRPGKGSGDSGVAEVLTTVEAREDLVQRLEEEFDRELMERAAEVVRARLEPATWEAFRLTALENVPAADVAQRLKKRVASVYVARSKVQKMLQAEIKKLQNEGS